MEGRTNGRSLRSSILVRQASLRHFIDLRDYVQTSEATLAVPPSEFELEKRLELLRARRDYLRKTLGNKKDSNESGSEEGEVPPKIAEEGSVKDKGVPEEKDREKEPASPSLAKRASTSPKSPRHHHHLHHPHPEQKNRAESAPPLPTAVASPSFLNDAAGSVAMAMIAVDKKDPSITRKKKKLKRKRTQQQLLRQGQQTPPQPDDVPKPYSRDFASYKDEAVLKLFAEKPSKAIQKLIEDKVLTQDSHEDIASFLHSCPHLDKVQKGEYLGDKEHLAVLRHYLSYFDFVHLDIDVALRRFLFGFRLPGEAQKIDRLMNAFASQFFSQNQQYNTVFKDGDAVYVLAFSIIMLHTDAHSSCIQQKMTLKEFIQNNKGVNGGSDFPDQFLESIYEKVTHDEIKMEEDTLFANAIKKGFVWIKEAQANSFGGKSSYKGLLATKEKWYRLWCILSYDKNANQGQRLFLQAFKSATGLTTPVKTLYLDGLQYALCDAETVSKVTKFDRRKDKAVSSYHLLQLEPTKSSSTPPASPAVVPAQGGGSGGGGVGGAGSGDPCTIYYLATPIESDQKTWLNLLLRYKEKANTK